MSTQGPLVELRSVSKRFGRDVALDAVDLTVSAGHIVGLLGNNGAGKSTLLRHIVGLYLPDTGSCRTFGHDAGRLPPELLARIGYVHQNGELLDWMTCAQLLRYVRSYYPTWNDSIETRFVRDFEIPLQRRIGKLSPGIKQRLAILVAVAFEPDLLILDEPASGLDPLARMQFLDLLLEIIQDTTRTIVISSHILSDVEKVIDAAVIMKAGRVLRAASFDSLQEHYRRLRLRAVGAALPAASPVPGAIAWSGDEKEALVTFAGADPAALDGWLAEIACEAVEMPLSLDEIFRLTVAN